MFSDTLNLCYYITERDQVSHPHKYDIMELKETDPLLFFGLTFHWLYLDIEFPTIGYIFALKMETIRFSETSTAQPPPTYFHHPEIQSTLAMNRCECLKSSVVYLFCHLASAPHFEYRKLFTQGEQWRMNSVLHGFKFSVSKGDICSEVSYRILRSPL